MLFATWTFMFLYHLMFISCLRMFFLDEVFLQARVDFYLFLFLSTLDTILINFILWRKNEERFWSIWTKVCEYCLLEECFLVLPSCGQSGTAAAVHWNMYVL